MKIVIDDKIPFIKGVLEPYAKVVYLPGGKISPADVVDADALVTRTRTKCNDQLLKNSNVKIIATATIGYDHIDVGCCRNLGIKWVNAPGCNSGSVMQYMASALVQISRIKRFSLKGKTLGIVGVGNVGSKVVRAGEAFGMKVLLNDPPRERSEGSGAFTDLRTLLNESDIVSIHVPLNMDGPDKTYHLFNEQIFSWMKPLSVLINTSRGETVETIALRNAIRTGKLLGTVLDVWEKEPHIDRELLQQVDIATPHIAGYSLDGKANGTAMSVQALSRHFGWNLNHWEPDDVPKPTHPLIELPANLNSEEEMTGQAVLKTYDIMEDDARLRADVESFERQRGNYPPRREFPSYTVKPVGRNELLTRNLRQLGFIVRD